MIIDACPNMIKDVSPQFKFDNIDQLQFRAEQWARDREYELSQERGRTQ